MTSTQMKVTFFALLALAIGLQLLDGYSTSLSLSTGHTEEKNSLITGLADLFEVSVMTSVWLSKGLVALLFAAAIAGEKPSAKSNLVLGGFCLTYVLVCANNTALALL